MCMSAYIYVKCCYSSPPFFQVCLFTFIFKCDIILPWYGHMRVRRQSPHPLSRRVSRSPCTAGCSVESGSWHRNHRGNKARPSEQRRNRPPRREPPSPAVNPITHQYLRKDHRRRFILDKTNPKNICTLIPCL